MKKLLVLVVALVSALTLVACVDTSTVLADEAHTYYATGQFAGWGDAVGVEAYTMVATSRGDERLSSVFDDLKEAKYVYVLEVILPDGDAGWTTQVLKNGEVLSVNGNLTVKVIQTDLDAEAPNWWGQGPESGEFKNLTPSTLYIPAFSQEADEAGNDWNANPAAFEAGTYYMVYVQYANASHGLGLIAK